MNPQNVEYEKEAWLVEQHFLLNGPSKLARYPLSGVAWVGPQLRTSNDHCFIVGVP
jgi:hypothetical protein